VRWLAFRSNHWLRRRWWGSAADPAGFKPQAQAGDDDRADLVLAMTSQIRDQAIGMAFGAGRAPSPYWRRTGSPRSPAPIRSPNCMKPAMNLSIVGRESISDPVGLSEAAYCEVGDRIADAVVPLMLALAPNEHGRPLEDEGGGLVNRAHCEQTAVVDIPRAQRAGLR